MVFSFINALMCFPQNYLIIPYFLAGRWEQAMVRKMPCVDFLGVVMLEKSQNNGACLVFSNATFLHVHCAIAWLTDGRWTPPWSVPFKNLVIVFSGYMILINPHVGTVLCQSWSLQHSTLSIQQTLKPQPSNLQSLNLQH